MEFLEKKIAEKYDTAILHASLPAACLYEHTGYKAVGYGVYELENDVKDLAVAISNKKVCTMLRRL